MVYGRPYARHEPRGSHIGHPVDDANCSRRSTTWRPEVVNDICSTWNSQNGICDDYDSNLDATFTEEWIEGQVRMVMETCFYYRDEY